MPQTARTFSWMLLLGWCLGPATLLAADASFPLRTLLLSGQNNHDWKQTTPKLQKILTNSGRFVVDITEHPEQCNAAILARYTAIVSNWNAFDSNAPVKDWPEQTRNDFLKFVREGGGFVVVHAGGCMFSDWSEFQKLIGATWGKGTGHGVRHWFEVKIIEPNHPITQGIPAFMTLDELWHRMVAQPEKKVLATAFSSPDKGGSGREEPVAMVTEFGKGRCFNLVLGHDVTAMESPGFQTLLLRGTEWAATGKVTLLPAAPVTESEIDAAIKGITSYRFGDGREALVALKRLIGIVGADAQRRKILAARLAALLASDATLDAKQFACRVLSLVGGPSEVPALASLLRDKDLGFFARFALERIPGEESLAAMRAALETASSETRLGLVNSLAIRQDAKAAPLIAKLTTRADDNTAIACLAALGKIGGAETAQALWAIEGHLSPKLRPAWSQAMLECAQGLLASGQPEIAAPILKKLSGPNQPKHVRIAAFTGYVACRASEASETMLKALQGEDPTLQAAAVRVVRETKDKSLTQAITEHLNALPLDVQAQVITLLAEREETAALSAISRATSSPDASVRRAALDALGSLGNATTVPVLAAMIQNASDDERKIIVGALSRLRGDGVDEAIVEAMKKLAPPAQCELIEALVARRSRIATPVLLASADSPDPRLRRAALNALARLADKTVCAELIQRLDKMPDQDRKGAESALASICRREGDATPLLDALPTATLSQKTSLLAALGTVGDARALQAIRSAVNAPEPEVRAAAVKALADWPDSTPLDDLFTIATTSADPRCQTLALRGLARLTPLATHKPMEKRTALLTGALLKTTRDEDRKALLGALGALPTLAAMKTAQEHLKSPALAEEAGMATAQIAEVIWQTHRAETREAITQVLSVCKNPTVLERASSVRLLLDAPKNLSLTATASSPDDLESDGAASGDQAALDGNPKTYWDEKDGQRLYILRITLKEPAAVAALRIMGYEHHNYAPKDFEVVCDGKPVKKVSNAQYQNNFLTVLLPETRCATVELRITGYYGRSPAIRELEIYGKP